MTNVSMRLRRLTAAGVLVTAAMLPSHVFAQAHSPAIHHAAQQQSFDSAEAAVEALIAAVRAGDVTGLGRILGPGSRTLIASGNAASDSRARANFLGLYDAKHALVPYRGGAMTLTIGADEWPLPIPIVPAGPAWHFDAVAGGRELVDRRIGRDELLTIQTLLTAVDAQKEYFDRTKRGGSGAYADKLVGTADAQDALYWPAGAGDPASPLGPLVDRARDDGYTIAASPHDGPTAFHGYLFRVLSAQGTDAPGGAKSYVHDGRLSDGFAFVAWPAEYDSTGIVTFLVDADGVVFQKNLGSATSRLAGGMTTFDPDLSWTRIDITN